MSHDRSPSDILVNTPHLEQELADLQATEEAERIDRPLGVEEGLKPWKIYPPLSLPVLVMLVPSSIFGVLARLGLIALTTYDGESIFPLAYVQAVGCLVMGFGLRLKEPISQFYGPFYTALVTGFCGSLTTFSSWQMDIFNSWINAGGYHRSGLHSFIDGVAKSVFTLSLSVASISFGYNTAHLLLPYLPLLPFPSKPIRYSWNVIAVCMYGAAFPVYFKMSPRFRHEATAALLFAFPGALTRYLLSVYVNPRIKALPLGTLLANLVGTALLGGFSVLQRVPSPVLPNACSLLQGLNDGYCGCLTTVSTFAAELRDLVWWKAVRYAAISWAGGQLLLLVIVGPSLWAGGVHKVATCTFEGVVVP